MRMNVTTMHFVYHKHLVHIQIGREFLQLYIFTCWYDIVFGKHLADIYDCRASVVFGNQHEIIDIMPLPLKLFNQRKIAVREISR